MKKRRLAIDSHISCIVVPVSIISTTTFHLLLISGNIVFESIKGLLLSLTAVF